MAFLFAGTASGLEFLWRAGQVFAAMKHGYPFRNVREAGALETAPDPTAGNTRDPLLVPAPSEVLGDIGLLFATHLALAFAVVFTLRMVGID